MFWAAFVHRDGVDFKVPVGMVVETTTTHTPKRYNKGEIKVVKLTVMAAHKNSSGNFGGKLGFH